MIFKVSKKVKGTLVLNSFKNPLSANSIVTVKGNDLYKDDIQAAIKAGVLIQQTQGDEKEYVPADITPRVTITNNLEKRLVLGKLSIAPLSSTYIPRTDVDEDVLRRAAAAKYISVIFDDEEIEEQYGGYPIDTSDEFEDNDMGDNDDTDPVIWDFNKEELENAPQVPSSKNTNLEDEEDEEDEDKSDEEEYEIEVDEVEPDDGEDEILDENTVIISKDKKGDVIVEEIEEEVIVVPKKTVTKKKLTKKKVVAKKKVSKPKSKKKVKTIQPTGEIRPPKTVMDAEIELDSMGKPLVDKPSDTLQSLIDEISGDDIGFVDKEQTIQRLKSRMG